jgi:ABC-type enterochelin transport system ATPase subunit
MASFPATNDGLAILVAPNGARKSTLASDVCRGAIDAIQQRIEDRLLLQITTDSCVHSSHRGRAASEFKRVSGQL